MAFMYVLQAFERIRIIGYIESVGGLPIPSAPSAPSEGYPFHRLRRGFQPIYRSSLIGSDKQGSSCCASRGSGPSL
jgi:hypothetical protein